MAAVKKRRRSLNSKYDGLFKSGHSPVTHSHSSTRTPSLIPDTARVQATGTQVRRDRLRNRQKLWDDLGFGPEEEQRPATLTTPTLTEFQYKDPPWSGGADTASAPTALPPVNSHDARYQSQQAPEWHEDLSLPVEWPFEPALRTASETLASSTDRRHEESGPKLPRPPPPAPIQLLWTPHGIISCNGEPVELYYPPNMTSALPPFMSSSPSVVHEVSQAVGIPLPDNLELWDQPVSAHDTARVSCGIIIRDDNTLQPRKSPRPPLRPSQVDEQLLRDVPRDDFSDSFHCLTFDEPASIGLIAHPRVTIQAGGKERTEPVDLKEGLESTDDERMPYHQRQPLSAAGDFDMHASATSRVVMARKKCASTAISGDPTSDAKQRSKLDYGSSPKPPDACDSVDVQRHRAGDERKDDISASQQSSLSLEPLLSRLVRSHPRSSMVARRASSQSGTSSPPPRASRTPYAPRKMTTKHTLRAQAPAPHTPIVRSRKPPVDPRLRTPDRHGQDSLQLLEKAPHSPPAHSSIAFPFLQESTSPQPLKSPDQKISDDKEAVDCGSEDELLLKPDVSAEKPAMAAEVMSNMNGLGGRQTNIGPGRVTPTLPPGSSTTPYHKPGLHTLSQTIFKRRPEAWANLTYLQQPGTNSLDPKTPAPPTPTIAPVDVWLGIGGPDEGDKRLESIGEVPELEDIEVDEEESESEEKASDTDVAESIRSFTPSQEKSRKRKKKTVRFNLDHEEFFYEPEPDARRILGLLKPRAEDEHDVGLQTAVYQIGGGTKTAQEQQKTEPAEETEGKKPSPAPASPASPAPSASSPSPASATPAPASPGPQAQAQTGPEDNKNDIGFTIYRDGY